jgi:hypothetical protein
MLMRLLLKEDMGGGLGCWFDVVSLYNSFPRGQASTSMRLHIFPHLYPGASALGNTEHTPPPEHIQSRYWSQLHEPAYAHQQHANSLTV